MNTQARIYEKTIRLVKCWVQVHLEKYESALTDNLMSKGLSRF